jgi:hypothetical protein
MGNSLSSINGNFAALSSAVCELSSVPAVDASVNVFDSPTIDLDWNASTRTLSAVTTASVATSSSPMVAKAWVNFDGTGSIGSQTIRSSYNVSSVTKNGTGDYTVNFATPMADANYSVCGTCRRENQATDYLIVFNLKMDSMPTQNSFGINTGYVSTLDDSSYVNLNVFGN